MFDADSVADSVAAAVAAGLETLPTFFKEDWLGGLVVLASVFALLLVDPQTRPRVELALVAALSLKCLGALSASVALSGLIALVVCLFVYVQEERRHRQVKELEKGACLTVCSAVWLVGAHCFALPQMTAVFGAWIGMCVCLLDYVINVGQSPVPVVCAFAVGFLSIAHGFTDAVVAASCCGLLQLALGMCLFLWARHQGKIIDMLRSIPVGMVLSTASFVGSTYLTLWFMVALCIWAGLVASLVNYIKNSHERRENDMLKFGATLLSVGTAWLLLSYYFGAPLMIVAALCSWTGCCLCFSDGIAKDRGLYLFFALGWLGMGYFFQCTLVTAAFGGVLFVGLGTTVYANYYRRNLDLFISGAALLAFGIAWFSVLYYFDWPLRMAAVLCGFTGWCICFTDHVKNEDPDSHFVLPLLPLTGCLIVHGFGYLFVTSVGLGFLALTAGAFIYVDKNRRRVNFDRLEASVISVIFNVIWLPVSYVVGLPPTVALSGGFGVCVCLIDYAEGNLQGLRLVLLLAPLGFASTAHWLGYTFIAAAWFCLTVVGMGLRPFLEANPQYKKPVQLWFGAALAFSLVYMLHTSELLAPSVRVVGAGGLLIGASTQYRLYVARLVGVGLLHSLGWLLPSLVIGGLCLLGAAASEYIKPKSLVPEYNCATLLPFIIPIYRESKMANDQDFHTLLQFRALLNQLEITLAGKQQLVDNFNHKVARQMGGRNVDQVMNDIAVSLTNLSNCTAQLGVEEFITRPTAAQKAQIETRNTSRKNVNEWVGYLGELITSESTVELGLLDQALEELLQRLDALTQDVPAHFISPSTPSCAESAKRLQIEETVAELVSLCSLTVSRADPCYARIASLCKINTQQELNELKNQVQSAIAVPNPFAPMLLALDHLVSAQFLAESLEVQSALDRSREVLRLVLELKTQHQENRQRIAYREELLLKLGLEDGRRRELIASIPKLLETNTELEFQRDIYDGEMKHLCASGHFPELVHAVLLEWEDTTRRSEAVDLRALLEQFDLLDARDVSGFGQATPRMQQTLAGNLRIKGNTHEDVEVVLKTLQWDESSMTIAEMRHMFQLCRVAQHSLLLPCLSGSLTANSQELQLVFPYMPGGDLAFWCQERIRPLSRKKDVLTQVCDALRALCQMGACHGKLNPSNIVMSSAEDDAVPKLINILVGMELGTERDEFCAPEAAWEGDVEKRDVFSFGAIAQWSGIAPTDPIWGPRVRRCLDASPQRRPNLKELHKAFSVRTCIICLNDEKSFKECVVCPDGAHSMCKPCFDRWVVDRLTAELGQRKEGIICFECNNDHHFPMQLYATHMGLVLRSQQERTEATMHQQIQEELRRAQAEEAALSGIDLAVRRAHEMLTSKCPVCTAAFCDFIGCCALTCSQCNTQFCAFCHQGASEDAHPHVARCAENPNPGQLFCSEDEYTAQQTEIKRRRLQGFLATLEVATQNQVRARLREYL
ncbi:hypothetical protein BASA81_002375 [Batrachochytrium salamandrivorans]|nr:hypothetical protein BASA81_002375 [Batrachochytrium salamandrivorans]